MSNGMTSFLCWGDVGWDEYEGEEQPRPGGCALNVALSLVAEGAPDVSCAAPIGRDGAALRALLERHGVDVGLLEERTGATPRQPIRLGPEGERELYGYQGGVLRGYAPGPPVLEAAARAGLVYVPVFDLTRAWAEAAWAAGAQVAVDLMDLSDVDPAFVERSVSSSRVVFAGLSRARHAAEIERLVALAAQPGAALVVVTLGAEGAWAFAGETRHTVTAAPVRRVVDTTGCGDAFAGAFLARWRAGRPLPEALLSGTTRAAVVAAHKGAVGSS